MKESKAFFPQKVIPTQVSLSGKMSRPVNTNNPFSSYSNHKQHRKQLFCTTNEKCKGGATTSVSFSKGSLPSAQVSKSQAANAEICGFFTNFGLIKIVNKILHMHKLSLFSGKQLWIICHIHHSSEEGGKKDAINENGGD